MDGLVTRFLEWLFHETPEESQTPCGPPVERPPLWASSMFRVVTGHLKDIQAEQKNIHSALRTLEYGEQDIMTAVQVEQEDLDAVAADLAKVGAALTQEIADLEAKVAAGTPLQAADLTGLRAAQTALDALAVPATAPPVDTPPADGGDTPPADGGDPPVGDPTDGGDPVADPTDGGDAPVDPSA